MAADRRCADSQDERDIGRKTKKRPLKESDTLNQIQIRGGPAAERCVINSARGKIGIDHWSAFCLDGVWMDIDARTVDWEEDVERGTCVLYLHTYCLRVYVLTGKLNREE